MLINWEKFGAFLSWLLRQEIFLTGDILNEFYCIIIDGNFKLYSVKLKVYMV
jgi:hypothetical protein